MVVSGVSCVRQEVHSVNDPDKLLTQAEVCQLLRVSAKTLQILRRERRIKFMRFGHRTIRFHQSAVLAFIAQATKQN